MISMLKVISSLYIEYGFIGLIIAFIVFYIGGSFFNKTIIKWYLETITTKQLLLRILAMISCATIVPFFLALYAIYNGNPIDENKLWQIFQLKSGGLLTLILFIIFFRYNWEKEKKTKLRMEKLKKELLEQRNHYKKMRQLRKAKKRNRKAIKQQRKNTKK